MLGLAASQGSSSALQEVRSAVADHWVIAAAGTVFLLQLLYAFLADPVFNADGYQELGVAFGDYWQSAHLGDTMRTPGYPLLLAAMYESGLGDAGVKVLQTILVTAGLFGLAAVARLSGDTRAARICAWLFVAYIPIWSYSAIARTEAVTVALLIFAVLALLLSERDERHRVEWTLLTGAMCSLAVIVRPNSLIAVAIIGAVLLYGVYRRLGGARAAAGAAVLLLLPALVIFSPWAARNVSHEGSLDLLGRNPFPLPLGIHLPYETDIGKFASFDRSYTYFSENREDGFTPEDARNFDALAVLKNNLREHPGEFLATRAVAEFQMWPWPATPRVDYAEESIVPYPLLMALHLAILIAGLIGLARLTGDPLKVIGLALVAALFAVHLLYVAHPRYTVPVFPFLIVGASLLLNELLSRRRAGIAESAAGPGP